MRYSRESIREALTRSVGEWHLGSSAWTVRHPHHIPTRDILDFGKYKACVCSFASAINHLASMNIQTNRVACKGSVGGALIARLNKGSKEAAEADLDIYQALMSSEPDVRESTEEIIYLYTFCGVVSLQFSVTACTILMGKLFLDH